MAEDSVRREVGHRRPQAPLVPDLPAAFSDDWLRAHGVEDCAALRGALRPEDAVSGADAISALKATRLSFARLLIRRMTTRRWDIRPHLIDVDARGGGRLIYTIDAEGRRFCFVAYSARNEGVERFGAPSAGNNYDFIGSLYEGDADLDFIDREDRAIKSGFWRARTGDMRTFGWTIATRSLSQFDHVVDSLVAGHQPDPRHLARGGGYIVRNAGWYGNGRHGSRASQSLPPDHPLRHHYFADLLALYMWRLVSLDIVEAIAQQRSSDAITLDEDVRLRLGIGNTSGLGMVANVVRWPAWVGALNTVRELSLAYAVSRRGPIEPRRIARFVELAGRVADYYAVQAPVQFERYLEPEQLSAGLRQLATAAVELANEGTIDGVRPTHPWQALADRARLAHREIYEQTNALIIEAESEFADAVAKFLPEMMNDRRAVDPRTPARDLAAMIEDRYAWALTPTVNAEARRHYFWYRSSANGENHRAERALVPGSENETFIDVPGAIDELHTALVAAGDQPLGTFLLEQPQFYHIASRAQLAARIPYTEIQGDILGRDFSPADIIRLFLGALGLEATAANEHAGIRRVSGVFYKGAPLPEQIRQGVSEDFGLYPSAGETGELDVRAAS